MSLPAQIGNYRLERELGRGASSEVWLARHAYLGDHTVAIKVLMSQDREAVRRFKREAAIAARLHHPNIVQLFDYGQSEPFYYTVLELIEGETLQQLLAARRRLSLPAACAIFDQIAAALDYAHGLTVVHRDVSPSNILIEEHSRRALLTDFGIARDATHPITVADTIMGTRGYHSPEHAQSAASVTHLSDLFSLGVVLYQMLSGEFPWASMPSLTDPSAFSPPIPLAERDVEGLPADVDRVLRTLLALDPSARYPSAALASAELRQILSRHEAKTQRIGAVPAIADSRPVELQASGVEPNTVERILAADLEHASIDRTHRRAEQLRDPAAIAALLDQWAEQDRLRRKPLLGRLARLHHIISRNVYFYRLRVLYERRESPEDEEEPDRAAQVFPVELELAPWDVPLPEPDSFADNPGGRVHVPGSTSVVACQPCNSRGFTVCPRCQGRQRVYVNRPVPASPALAPASPAGAAAPAAGQPRPAAGAASPGGQPRPAVGAASPGGQPRPAAGAASPGGQPRPAAGAPGPTAPAPPRSEQVLVPCPECSGRGGITCTRCTGVGRLVRRKAFRWSRKGRMFKAQDDLPALDEDWLARTCKAELVYRERQVGGMRPEWGLIPPIAELIAQAEAGRDANTRITLSELSITLIPLTEVVFDLGKTDEGDLYRLAIYGFENLIPPDWRFFNWERVILACVSIFLLVVILVLLPFALM
jgi:eukaryotic-like serine/threonine-protein kinase